MNSASIPAKGKEKPTRKYYHEGCQEGRGKTKGGTDITEAAMLYSSTKGSFVRWICKGSSVERETFKPRRKNIGKGFR